MSDDQQPAAPRSIFERMTNPNAQDGNGQRSIATAPGADIRLFLERLLGHLNTVREDLTIERLPNGWTITYVTPPT